MQNTIMRCEDREGPRKGRGPVTLETTHDNSASVSLSHARILVVDDQALLREAVAFEFEMLGCQADQAENGEIALRLFKDLKPDIIISDIRMPVWDGVRLLDEVRHISKQQPAFIFMTGFSDLQLPMAYQRGADAFLTKPLYPESLESTLRRLLVPMEKRWLAPSSERPVFNVAAQFSTLAAAMQKKEILVGRRGLFLNKSLLPKNFASSTDRLVAFQLAFKEEMFNTLEGFGRVRWVREQSEPAPAGLGIEFEFLAEPGRELLLRYVNEVGVVPAIPDGSVKG